MQWYKIIKFILSGPLAALPIGFLSALWFYAESGDVEMIPALLLAFGFGGLVAAYYGMIAVGLPILLLLSYLNILSYRNILFSAVFATGIIMYYLTGTLFVTSIEQFYPIIYMFVNAAAVGALGLHFSKLHK